MLLFFMSTPAAAAHNIWLISHANLARLQPPSFFLPFPPPAPRAVRIDSPNYLCRKMCKYCVHYCLCSVKCMGNSWFKLKQSVNLIPSLVARRQREKNGPKVTLNPLPPFQPRGGTREEKGTGTGLPQETFLTKSMRNPLNLRW